MRDCYLHAGRRLRESPNDMHSFCPGPQMMKTNFEPIAIDDLLRHPRDWNPGTLGCHDYNIAIGSAFEKPDVPVMWKYCWPQLQVCRCFEDHGLRRVHDNGIYFVHRIASVRWKPAQPAMLRTLSGIGTVRA